LLAVVAILLIVLLVSPSDGGDSSPLTASTDRPGVPAKDVDALPGSPSPTPPGVSGTPAPGAPAPGGAAGLSAGATPEVPREHQGQQPGGPLTAQPTSVVAPPVGAPQPTAAAPNPPAPAGESCSPQAATITDYRNRSWSTRYHCPTYTASAVYANVGAGSGGALDDSGYMAKSSSVWVICQLNGRANPEMQGNTNTWWLYTQADSSRANAHGYTSAWGYLPATAVSYGGQNEAIPGVPVCASYL
jgi:hypothetical protein